VKLRRKIGNFIRRRNSIDIEEIQISLDQMPATFSSLRVAHVSDVHIPRAAFPLVEIAKSIANQQPDVIFLTGDLIDGHAEFESKKLAEFIELLLAIAPVFAVSGNHESRIPEYYNSWKQVLEDSDAQLLENKVAHFEKDGVEFIIIGMKDFKFNNRVGQDFQFLTDLAVTDHQPILLLHHKPNIWRSYYPKNAPLPQVVFSGHAHAGQVVIPGLNRGIIAPDQGLLPKYISGLYHQRNGSKEVVSRGLASSTRPVRINNRPHLPLVELVPTDQKK